MDNITIFKSMKTHPKTLDVVRRVQKFAQLLKESGYEFEQTGPEMVAMIVLAIVEQGGEVELQETAAKKDFGFVNFAEAA